MPAAALLDQQPASEERSFFWDETGQYELYVLDVTQRATSQLTSGKGPADPHYTPVLWAPPGEGLYLHCVDEGDEQTEFFRINLQEETEHVASVDSRCIMWAVSPDESVERERLDAACEDIKTEFLGRCIDDEERAQRERCGQRLLLGQLDDEVVHEYARSLEAAEKE